MYGCALPAAQVCGEPEAGTHCGALCQPPYTLFLCLLCLLCLLRRFVDDPELAYIVERARQVHDFWHVLFNCHTNAFGEVALKAVEFLQVTRLAIYNG
jgi:hypothetical protein